jgi:hypothetical protein
VAGREEGRAPPPRAVGLVVDAAAELQQLAHLRAWQRPSSAGPMRRSACAKDTPPFIYSCIRASNAHHGKVPAPRRQRQPHPAPRGT